MRVNSPDINTATVVQAATAVTICAAQVLKPTGEALAKLPELKQAMEQRRSATLDFDAYHRRVEALETKLTTNLSSKKAAKVEGELATEMAKLERAKVRRCES